MSVTRHHAEWLSLIEVSGPFLSMPVLMRVFPQGLDPREPEKAKELRLAYEEWLEKPNAPGRHQAWVRFVLTRFLEFPETLVLERQSIPSGIEAHIAEYGEMLRPDYAIVAPPGHVAAGKPHLLLQVYPPGQNPDGPVAGKHWKASPATRMTELLHAMDISLGMIANGEQWMLVYAPRNETSGYATWDAGIWQEEPITLRAFSSIMHARRFFGVAEGDTLQALLKESARDQQEVTDQLGFQVRRAVEVLVQAFDRLDQESGRQSLHDIEPKELYDAGLTVMMRLVFLFSAEERSMLRLGEPLYDENYAASTLREQLREAADQHGEEVLERRVDAWARLLATFRAVYGGIAHETLRLPAYGGALFDPDRYPFLEGRPAGTDWRRTSAEPLAVNNRVVLHLLESLQLLQMKVPGGGPAEARRLSFRALDIEQIGHVYEGLLDHTAIRANTTILGLQGTKNKEPEIPLDKLEQLRADGEKPLIEYLKEETKRSEQTLQRALAEKDQVTINDRNLVIACSESAQLYDRILPFAGLLRVDSFDMPVVILPGSVYVTEGTARRSTGTHYTPKTLTEPIVQHTLEPLVYEGPAEGRPKDQWRLRSPRAILALRVCDMTMGSGAFLVQSCRYLAERLVEAWENTEQASPGSFVVTPDGEFSTGDPAERLLPMDPDERLVIARRAVADRCLYGVDINPMAVEMAKLSLWLVTLQKDRPFTFLDHALKCGDSLLGVSNLEQIENFSLRTDVRQITFATANLFRYIEEAANKRRQLETLPSESSRLAEKMRLHAEAETATAKVKAIADVIIALELQGLKDKAYEDARFREAEQVQRLILKDADEASIEEVKNGRQSSALTSFSKEQLKGRRTFHWALEFPEIFERCGFDAFAGNPPFMGGSKITIALSTEYRNFIVKNIAGGKKGKADLCAYFVLRALELLNKSGNCGIIATNSISQGDTRQISLSRILNNGCFIYRAESNSPWPRGAGITVAIIWITTRSWRGVFSLDGVKTNAINSYLTSTEKIQTPHILSANMGKAFRGTEPKGLGFVLNLDEAKELLQDNPKNQEVIYPYITGQDLYSQPNQSASRMIINFQNWNIGRAQQYRNCFDRVTELVKPYRDTITKQIHELDYWKYWDKRLEKYEMISSLPRVLARSYCGNMHALAFLPLNMIYDTSVVVIAASDYKIFAVLQSTIHELWARLFGPAALRTDMRYATKSCFETFPFPKSIEILEAEEALHLGKSGMELYKYRAEILLKRQEGLTSIYNRFHSPSEKSDDISHFRSLHEKMDQDVAIAYGWTDLDLGHDFHQTNQGIRFTISQSAWCTVLDRLLALNHERYVEEVKADLHKKKVASGSGKGRKMKSFTEKKKDQYEIFEE